ncbi:MAG: hypothetical protein K2G53_10215 [Muribaculaceae bacterium]|nr:hypothetical protein [Muribaculaceae bacterium]
MNRRNLNITLIVIAILLSGLAVRLAWLPPHISATADTNSSGTLLLNDSNQSQTSGDAVITPLPTNDSSYLSVQSTEHRTQHVSVPVNVKSTGFEDVDPRSLINSHPFRKEALKILNNNLEENDSLSRRKILSYCEHLRTSYTTKDIDFIRQVFSDNALIIVGNVVKTGEKSNTGYDTKVSYAVRSKESYLSRLEEVFRTNGRIKLDFSDFRIMRHPSIMGIYGVSLRQKYATDRYSDDGYLFLLWDFRNPSMPQIHVRTWQPHKIIAQGEEVIDISDFNLE